MRVNALYLAIRLHSAENVLSSAVPEVPPGAPLVPGKGRRGGG